MVESTAAKTSIDDFDQLIDQLVNARALGRSPVYLRLLKYLAEQTVNGKVCSEYAVAVDVFDKENDYDVTADSTVRVYIHNLRKKLDSYYQSLGQHDRQRLTIPKGEYRLVIEDAAKQDSTLAKLAPETKSSMPPLFAGLLGAVLAAVTSYFLIHQSPSQEALFSTQQNQFWGGIISDEKPILIVLGDYFIFAEERSGQDLRLVREFDVNSASDLRQKDARSFDQSEQVQQRFDLGLTYLPRGSAHALAQVERLLQKTNKEPRISMMSEFSAEDLRANHIIYIGYLSGLGVLESYIFADSRFEVGLSYDSLIDKQTNSRYQSDLIEVSGDQSFIDFGLVSSFSVIGSNKVVSLMGTRDAGLMEMSDIVVADRPLELMALSAESGQQFEALFEVDGFNQTNISSRLLVSDYLNQNPDL